MNTDQSREQLIHIIENSVDLENLTGSTFSETAADAILAEDVVIKRADLPEVVEEGGNVRVDGDLWYNHMPAAKRRKKALVLLALAEYLDAREAREAEAAKEAELTARRDALATELVKKAYGDQRPGEYASQTAMMQAAINRIIKAEDKLAERGAEA